MNRIRSVFLAAFVLLCFTQPAPAQESNLVITGVTLIDGTGASPQENVTIVAQDGKIAAVGATGDVAIPEAATVIDAAGMYVIPGLVDMHVHFGRGGGVPGGLPNSPEYVERALRQFLFYGVTSVLNLGAYYGLAPQIIDLRRRKAEGTILAPHIYATGGLLTVPGAHPVGRWGQQLPDSVDAESYDWTQRGVWVVRTPEEVREVVRHVAAAGMDAIKVVIESDSLARPYPEGLLMPMDMVQAAVEEGHEHGLPVVAHVSDPGEVEVALDAGVDALAHLGGEPPGPDLLARMQQQGVYLIPTLSVYIWVDMWGDPADNLTDPFLRRGADEEVVESMLASPRNPTSAPTEEDWAWRRNFLAALKAAHDAGVPLAAGSDAPAGINFHGYNMHHEVKLMVEAGLTPMEALEAATRRPAEMLGAGAEFGTVEPGKRADLLILGANPLEDITNTRRIRAVVADGRLFRRADLDRLLAEVESSVEPSETQE